jgi:uronate dehydrogenase
MAAQATLPPDPVGDRYQGGTYPSNEYDADKKR